VSVGEQRHPRWVLEHPGRATGWVRAATTSILPEAADVPIYLRLRGGRTSLCHRKSPVFVSLDDSS
jgi:hypothetical protein